MPALALPLPGLPSSASAHRMGLIYAVLGAIGFSFKAILIKLAYPYGVDAITMLALRMGFAFPFFVALGWRDAQRHRMTRQPLLFPDFMQLAALGFSGYYLASYLDFLGLQYISAGLERLILFAYPTLVVVFSALFLKKPITRRALISIMLCYSGIGLAVVHDFKTAGEPGVVLYGGGLVFLGAISYALYLMGNGQAVARLGAVRVTAWASGAACVFCLLHFGLTRPWSSLAQPAPVLMLGAAMAFFSTVLPVWMISEAMRHLGAARVSLIGTLGPIVTLFLGWVILGEQLGITQMVGGALVLAGVVWVSRKG
ncbi:DMT family transporter [Zoogloea sp.]|uniref:DMT family transporter n=1 Tax=Zoogloea sp. TaxID=49181 RepID=UPI003F66E347